MRNRKRIIFFGILMTALLLGLSACDTEKKQPAAAVKEAEAIMDKHIAGWITEDPDVLMSTFEDDFIGFDALNPGWSYDFQYAEGKARDSSYWGSIAISEGSSFVSNDGMFGVNLSKMYFALPGLGELPNVHIVAFRAGKVVFSYDYYGGAMSGTEPLPAFSPRTIEPGSDEAVKLVEEATATVKKWQKAYNERNIEEYVSCFAEDVKYVDIVKPDWRIMTKGELLTDVKSKFSSTAFKSKLSASVSSPIPDGFFVSSDGHYAAAQGTYEEAGKVSAKPMAVILEIQKGKIVKQYNFILIDRASLISENI